MIKELEMLAKEVSPENPETSLYGLRILVTGIKPGLTADENIVNQIFTELMQMNKSGVDFIIPEQGQRIEF
jgi:cAMP phosphodiesterase